MSVLTSLQVDSALSYLIAIVLPALDAIFPAFEDKPWAGLLAAFGGTVVISALIEAARRIRSRWKGGTGRA